MTLCRTEVRSLSRHALSNIFELCRSARAFSSQVCKRCKAASRVGASAIAGFFASAFSLPFDFVKTMMQNQRPSAHGVLPYRSSLDCVVKTLSEGGPARLYAGFPTCAHEHLVFV